MAEEVAGVGWRLLWLLLLLVPVAAAVVLLAALGHRITEAREDLLAAQAQVAALQAELATAREGALAATAAATAAAARAAGRLSGPPAGTLAAGTAVEGSATVVAVLGADRYQVRLAPATPELVLRYPAPQRLRVGQALAFAGTLAAQPGPRGLLQVDVQVPPVRP